MSGLAAGGVLEEVQDAWGVMRVLESGDYRFLEFGDAIEQSCSFIGDPAWLEYDYTRAMLLGALCHPAPESALFLGLGGGSLTQACLEFLPLDDVEVIELRPEVPRLAMQYLGLRDDPRLTLRIGDAAELMPSAERCDLLFVDLYTDSGPAAAHLTWAFLEGCRAQLNEGGWLIINQWGCQRGMPLGAALLRGVFYRHYWELPVSEGNVILLVPADLEQQPDRAAWQMRAEQLSTRLGYDLLPLLAGLRPAS